MNFHSHIKIAKRVCLSFGKTILLFVPMIGLFMMPTVTHAWCLFFCEEAAGQAELEIKASDEALAPSNNPDPLLNIAPDLAIEHGDTLLSMEGPSTDAPEKIGTSNGQISIYTVRSGDTLADIAKMFDVSVNTILWANDMTKATALKVGQTLVILPVSGVLHTVVSGDTLKTITKKYNGDINEIASFNDLKITDKLTIGDTIMIPDGQVYSSPSANTKITTSRLVNAGGPLLVGYFAKPFIGGHKTQGLHGYNGVDYGMPVGNPIYAAAGGTIIISKNSGYNGGYGDYIVIQHPNYTQTVYGHLSNTTVSFGQTVNQGQLIGYSGNTGRSTGPHLHFEVRGAKNPF